MIISELRNILIQRFNRDPLVTPSFIIFPDTFCRLLRERTTGPHKRLAKKF
jgi:hypothetical protein